MPLAYTPRLSPIGPSEEEELIIQQFFTWKMGNTQSERTKEKLRQVSDTIKAEMWSIYDLATMSDSQSNMYRLARELGIPDGLARGFKADLREFKPQYRQAKALLALAQ